VCVLALLLVETCAGKHNVPYLLRPDPPCMHHLRTLHCRLQAGFQRRRYGLRRPIGTKPRLRKRASHLRI